MTGDRVAPPLLGLLLQVIFDQRITGPDSDAGLASLAAASSRDASIEEWRSAVADALAAGYVRDPVRLSAGALQCHWYLELTPEGVEAVRQLRSARDDAL